MSAGARVGDYVLGEPIGAGGMGVVYAAMRSASDGRRLAVKMLYRDAMVDARAVRRFRDEAIAGCRVHHPHVMSVVDRGETDDGLPFLVMERVVGERLAERIHRDGPLPIARAFAIVRQVLAGVRAIHEAGVIHGDVKTDNILVEAHADATDTATLIDFGLARVASPLGDEVEPRDASVVCGTPDYMAPEVITGSDPTPRSDLYAVGIVLYELITGLTPFGGGTSEEIVQRHLDDDATPPSSYCRGRCPRMLDRVIARALEKNPAHRFASAAAFARALYV